jgi:hypothetical protein
MFNGRRRRVHLLGLAAVAFLAMPARGQPQVEEVDSLEWMAADSALVVRGTIVAMETETTRSEHTLWRTVTFRVDRTLKGEHRPTLRFVVWTNTVNKEIDRWKEQGRPLLAFLEESRCLVASSRDPEYARFPFAPRSGEHLRSFVELDPRGDHPAYTMDLRVLTWPEEILRATEAAIAVPPAPGKRCGIWLDLPGTGGFVRVTVPTDSRLEERARGWVRSEDQDFRLQGATALMSFRSDENATILRGLLDDPGSWDRAIQEGGRFTHTLRVRRVREEAYDVLRAWGYEVPRPVLREKLFPPGDLD